MKQIASQIFEPILVFAIAGLFSVSVLAEMVEQPAKAPQAHAGAQLAGTPAAHKAA